MATPRLYDAWSEAPTNAPHLRAVCKIVIGGRDVTSNFDPHLLSMSIRLSSSEDSECDILLDDRDASLRIPADQEDISIFLGWQGASMALVFAGRVAEPESSCFRKGGGRQLSVGGTGVNRLGKAKEAQRFTMGDGEGEDITLTKFLEAAAKNAGLSVKVSKDFDNIKRKFWSQNESFMNLGARLGRELGGDFKIEQDTAQFTSALGGFDVAGETMQSIDAEWRKNLIGWRIRPKIMRPQFKEATSKFFDFGPATWKQVEKNIMGAFNGSMAPFTGALASLSRPNPAPNQQVGDQMNGGLDVGSQISSSSGHVIIDGNPLARPGAHVNVIGARPDVDGYYLIEVVEHLYSRNGFSTRLTVARAMGNTSGVGSSGGQVGGGGSTGSAPAGGGTG